MNNRQKLGEELLQNIKKRLPELEKLLEEVTGHWEMEDYIYRFYHNSFKVYYIQDATLKIVDALKKLAPEGTITEFNEMFEQILKEGTGMVWNSKHNEDWLKHTRPMVEAFCHALYFLKMCVKYGKELEEAPEYLPSGWASVLYLFNLR